MNLYIFKNLSLKKKIFINIVFTLLLLGVLIYFIAIPSINEIKTIGENINKQGARIDEEYQKCVNLKKLASDLKKIEPDLAKIDQIFVNREKELELIKQLEQTASSSNVAQIINIKDISGDKARLSLAATGDFNELFDYLLNLESLNYYLNIKSLSLSASSATISPSSYAEIETDGEKIKMAIETDIFIK